MLNAILCVWNEEDIIASCVAHLYAQGCDKVFLLDNASTDRTVQQGLRAGAVYHASFESGEFDETQKTVYLNKCVLGINGQLAGDRIWWLYADADEFPDFGTGASIAETLKTLPGDVRAVGSRVCNHLPSHEPYCLPGLHPADFMPVAALESAHWKFNLLRHDKDQPPMYSCSGAHTYNSNGGPVAEAQERLIVHHFNYRRPEATKKRLERLVLPDARGKRRIDWYDRMARIDGRERSVYHERLERMEAVYAHNRLANLKTPRLPYDYGKLRRWYDPSALDESRVQLEEPDYSLWRGSHLYYLGEYAAALEAFGQALEKTVDPEISKLLLLNMARCRRETGGPAGTGSP